MTRNEAIEILNTIPTIGKQVDALEMAIEALEKATPIPNGNLINFGDIGSPTIKPLVKHGEWSLSIDDWFGDCYKCSACGEEFILNEGTPKDNGYNYCPNCGAKMEGEEQ